MIINPIASRIRKDGTIAYKPVEELVNSNYMVELQCDLCERIITKKWPNRMKSFNKQGIDICNSCSKSGSRNSQHNLDRSEILAHARTFNKENPMKGRTHSLSAKSKMSLIKSSQISNGTFDIKSNNRGHKLRHLSTKSNDIFFADSALEKLRMEQLDNDKSVSSWTKRHGIKIPYEHNGISRNYVPDFLVTRFQDGIETTVLEEVKGRVTEVDLIKKQSAEKYCSEQGYLYSFITQTDMNKEGEYRKFLKTLKEKLLI